MIQLARTARVRVLFEARRWEPIPKALEELASSIGSDTCERDGTSAEPPDPAWRAHLTSHLLIFRALWAGRTGDDKLVKSLLKGMYNLIDECSERGLMQQMRLQGGVVEVGDEPKMANYSYTCLCPVAQLRRCEFR
jgi:hypothetical protein